MPKWGLTVEQRASKPWKLSESLLGPGKTITDPIHGDIYLTRLETAIVNSPPMQRLRRVRQLGTTFLVYPGATHTRLSHSLGALRVGQDILDQVLDQRNGPDAVPDIFGEWSADESTYARKVAEATVLVRLGALLHDLCHVPYGHSIEDDLEILVPHDENEERLAALWKGLPEEITRELHGGGLGMAVRPLILSKVKAAAGESDSYAFVADIVGNTICADLLDYLERDHLFTGLPAKLGTRVLAGFYVTPSTHKYYPARIAMRITRHGRLREDVISELFKYLRYRYELSERALTHHAKVAADAMIGKALELWKEIEWRRTASRELASLPQAQDSEAGLRVALAAAERAEDIARVDKLVREELERVFLRYGDDGLLEHLRDMAESERSTEWKPVASLVTGLLDRNLYKPVGMCRSARPQAKKIHSKYALPAERRGLEERTARFAGVPAHWIVVWVPPPQMRMKAAGVLVDDDDGKISTLFDLDSTLRGRGKEIYESHEALWAVTVCVAPELQADHEKCQVVLSCLAEEMGIRWDQWASKTPDVLAAEKVAAELDLRQSQQAELLAGVSAAYGRGSTFAASTFAELVDQKRTIGESLRVPAQGLLTLVESTPKKPSRKGQ